MKMSWLDIEEGPRDAPCVAKGSKMERKGVARSLCDIQEGLVLVVFTDSF